MVAGSKAGASVPSDRDRLFSVASVLANPAPTVISVFRVKLAVGEVEMPSGRPAHSLNV